MGGLLFSRMVVMPGRIGLPSVAAVSYQLFGGWSHPSSAVAARRLRTGGSYARGTSPRFYLMPEASVIEDHLDVPFASGRACGRDGLLVGLQWVAGTY